MPRPADLQEPELSPAMQRVVAAMSISIAVHLALIGLLRVHPVAAPVAATIPAIQVRLQPPAPLSAAPMPQIEAPAAAPEIPPQPTPQAPPKPASPPPPVAVASTPPPVQAAPVVPPTVPSMAAPANPAPPVSSSLPAVNVPLLVDPVYYTARQLDVQPRALAAINPVYPQAAIARGASGWVELRLKLDESGGVQDIEVSDASPPGIFDQSALDAFRKAQFAPAQKAGRAVKSLVVIKVRYELDK
ncbi:MAG TPA: energy transducer TonB [Sulfuriferula sp.]|nr:energy transducer TonB [Sulfuriferula sp.]